MEPKIYSVYGICNPLMDLIAYKDHAFINSLGAKPGTMNLISLEESKVLLSKIDNYDQIPGGSCANTLRGIAWMSAYDPVPTPVYSGCVGKEQRGQEYIRLMHKAGINALISTGELETGFSLIIVTPDFERTMFTYLGACQEFGSKGIDFDILAQTAMLHIAGYMWDTDNQKQAVTRAIKHAREQGVKVSFDLADPFVVNRNRDDFRGWLANSVDILFGNAEEFALLTGVKGAVEDVVTAAGKFAALAIIKAGAKGCYVNEAGSVFFSPAVKVKAIDTVGAGDSFAAGFLYGLLKNKSTQAAAVLANTVAANIVAVEGCNFAKLKHEHVFNHSM